MIKKSSIVKRRIVTEIEDPMSDLPPEKFEVESIMQIQDVNEDGIATVSKAVWSENGKPFKKTQKIKHEHINDVELIQDGEDFNKIYDVHKRKLVK